MRFAAEKDPDLWLETAAVIAAARPDVRFVLAGYGEHADDVARKVQEFGVADRVILPGPTADVGLVYAAMDVLMMTSRFEGVPNVLIEAQAAGVPVVAPAEQPKHFPMARPACWWKTDSYPALLAPS